jgi:hypothetical protein
MPAVRIILTNIHLEVEHEWVCRGRISVACALVSSARVVRVLVDLAPVVACLRLFRLLVRLTMPPLMFENISKEQPKCSFAFGPDHCDLESNVDFPQQIPDNRKPFFKKGLFCGGFAFCFSAMAQSPVREY